MVKYMKLVSLLLLSTAACGVAARAPAPNDAEAPDAAADAESSVSDGGDAESEATTPFCAPSPSSQLSCFGSSTFEEGTSVSSDTCMGSNLDAFLADAGPCYRPSGLEPLAHVWCCIRVDPCAPRQAECAEAGVTVRSDGGGIAVTTACSEVKDRSGCEERGDLLCCP